MFEKVWYAIEGKSWYDAKRKARAMYKRAVKVEPENHDNYLEDTTFALTQYHAELYGRGLCDASAIVEFLRK